jgi:hypothetical protein
MPCLFAVFAGFFPRLADIFLWIARPHIFLLPFNGNWFWPLLGIIFLPFSTLMYVLLWSPGVGLVGFDWLWIVLAVLMDLSSLFGHYQAYQGRLPSYYERPQAT